MAVRVTIDSAVEPLSIQAARDWCRIDNEEEDTLLASLITAARQYVEDQTGRALITKTCKLTLDTFHDEIRLPYPPCISIASNGITYVDENGVAQTLAPTVWQLDTESEPARLTRAYDQSWPTIRSQPGAVSIVYTAGYGANGSYVPQGLKQAMLFLVSHWYEHREAVMAGTTPATVPLAVESLVWQHKVPEVG